MIYSIDTVIYHGDKEYKVEASGEFSNGALLDVWLETMVILPSKEKIIAIPADQVNRIELELMAAFENDYNEG
jgi:hypothetical protein